MKTLFILLIAGLTTLTPAIAQKKVERAEDKKEERKEVIMHRGDDFHSGGLNLTEDQKKKIKDIKSKSGRETIVLKNQVAEKKARLTTLMSMDKPSMNEVNTTVDEMHALKAQLQKKKIAMKMEIRNLLTDEQRMNFDMHHNMEGGIQKRMKLRMHDEGNNMMMFHMNDGGMENKMIRKKIKKSCCEESCED